MSDRTEALLAELVELQRRTVANQEAALAVQQRSVDAQAGSIELQRLAVNRQRTALRVIFGLVALALVSLLIPAVFAWVLRR